MVHTGGAGPPLGAAPGVDLAALDELCMDWATSSRGEEQRLLAAARASLEQGDVGGAEGALQPFAPLDARLVFMMRKGRFVELLRQRTGAERDAAALGGWGTAVLPWQP